MEQWTSENDASWYNIRHVETAHAAMAQAVELTCARRNAGKARGELDGAWQKLSDELELRLRHLQKICNKVIDRYLEGQEAAVAAASSGPSVPNGFISGSAAAAAANSSSAAAAASA